MADKLTRKELAAAWGVSVSYIGKLVRTGSVREIGGRIDRAEADQARAAMAPAMVAKEAEAKALGGQANTQQAGGTDIVRARTAEAVLKAKHRELIVKRMSGALVEISSVRSQAFEAGRAVTAVLKAIPARNANMITARISGLPPKEAEAIVKEILEGEVRRIADDLVAALEKILLRKDAA